ncbi:MAG: outer membrane lipoprotein carrier protein LolA [Ignavibacteriae bacterium HGW-Ignavibacteriae-3]|nr:MAG: outer membrane lipoprotein carrier protein LolA [Ignavibacteriae bacterium HGW-Ignavibacteriae-3]
MKTKYFLFLLLAGSIVYPQSANQSINKLQSKFKSITNFTANFSQNYYNAQGHEQEKGSGTLTYQRKNKFVVVLKYQLIVSDGETVWNNDKRFNRVVISNLSDDPTTFSLERFIFDYPPLCKIKLVKDDPAYKGEEYVELTPKDQDMEFKYVRIWMAPDGMISKLEVLDLGDIRYSFQFSDIKTNQDLPDSRFIFYPPKGIKIIDLR